VKNIFTQHPSEVGEEYLEHGYHAMKYALTFLCLSLVAIIHAVFPFLFKTAASDKVMKMADNMRNRNPL
jgi:uncharacterized membrane protein